MAAASPPGIWVDHCTFTKSYDGVLDIKRGASAITVSWSEVVPAATGPGSFVQRQFDDLEANRATNVMYNVLRGRRSQPGSRSSTSRCRRRKAT